MRIFLIVGPRNSGKTTFCTRLNHAAKEQGFISCGCLEVSSRGTDDRPYHIELFDIVSGNSYPAAQRPRDSSLPFEFEEASFSYIRESCIAALDSYSYSHFAAPRELNRVQDTSLTDGFNDTTTLRGPICIIDEIGPLELKERRGHSELLEHALQSKSPHILVLTVRPSLADELKLYILHHGLPESIIKFITVNFNDYIYSTNVINSILGIVHA